MPLLLPLLFAAAYATAWASALHADPAEVQFQLFIACSVLTLPVVLLRLFFGIVLSLVATAIGALLSVIFPPLLFFAAPLAVLFVLAKIQKIALMIPLAILGLLLYGLVGLGPHAVALTVTAIGAEPSAPLLAVGCGAIGFGVFLSTNLGLSAVSGRSPTWIAIALMGFAVAGAAMLLGAEDVDLDELFDDE
jgi:hypothetical protein